MRFSSCSLTRGVTVRRAHRDSDAFPLICGCYPIRPLLGTPKCVGARWHSYRCIRLFHAPVRRIISHLLMANPIILSGPFVCVSRHLEHDIELFFYASQ